MLARDERDEAMASTLELRRFLFGTTPQTLPTPALTDRIAWMRRLPEMGTIYSSARDELAEIDARMAKLRKEMEALARETEEIIARAEKECAQNWTADDIRQAKEATW